WKSTTGICRFTKRRRSRPASEAIMVPSGRRDLLPTLLPQRNDFAASFFLDRDFVFASEPAEPLHHQIARGVNLFDEPGDRKRAAFAEQMPDHASGLANLFNAARM